MKIGTDFSGIGSPEMALKLLNIEHKQVFACEIDKYARKSFEAIHGNPQTFYKDITKRDHSVIPQLDLYVAGFPCQAFSMAGKRKGFDDVRGTLFFNVAEFIKMNQPKCFILENVKGLISHDSGKTFQTIISLLTDNGGTANGQIFIPYFEDGLGYHIYYKVLNTKDYGIPQNRERIFIVGFKEFREFNFPKPFPLELRLKDMLQDNPDYKYFLSDKTLKKLEKHQNPIINKNENDDFSGCIHAGYYKMGGRDQQYVIDDKYFLSDKMIEWITKHRNKRDSSNKFPLDENDTASCIMSRYYKCSAEDQYLKVSSATSKGYEEAGDGDSINLSAPNSKTRRGRVGKGVAQTLDTACNQAVVHNIPEQVKIRKYAVDIPALQKCLKKHKKYTNKQIAEKLKVKKTTADHWFRTDTFFAIPDAEIWMQLKELLEIKTDEFDKSIMTFIIQDGVFEKNNRVYDEIGIAPTLTKAAADEKILTKVKQLNPSKESGGKQPYQQNRIYDIDGLSPALNANLSTGGNMVNTYKIRRLTPLECFRLQGFPDEAFFRAEKVNSDTQLYKQAGNSITTCVMVELFKKIYYL